MSLAATLGLAAKARPAAHHGGRLAPFAVGAAVAALVVAGFLLAFWGRPINHDTAWYLIATRDWLAGARLYADIYEVNPPLNFYYTVPAVLLSDALGITDTNAQVLVTAGVTFASLFWCWTILRQRMRLGLPRQALFLAGLGAATILPATRDIASANICWCCCSCPGFSASFPAAHLSAARSRSRAPPSPPSASASSRSSCSSRFS